MAFLCAHFSILRVLSGSRWLLFGGYPSTQHKRHFVDETPCVVEQIESFRSERLRRGGWNHGLCSKYTCSVLRAGRMAFCRETCNAKTMTVVQMRNDVRSLSKPQWFHTYLFDLLATKRIHVCKQTSTQTRSRIAAAAQTNSKAVGDRRSCHEEQYNPEVMHDGLLQQLKINTLSLPSCLRPGKNPR